MECRELNLLTGINGMGKSTLIQALLLRQTYERADFVNNHVLLNGRCISLGSINDISYWYKNI